MEIILKMLSRIIYKLIPIEIKKKINSPLKKILIDKASRESFEYFEKIFQNCLLFETTLDIREYAIKTAVAKDPDQKLYYLEFGVFKGTSINYFSNFVNKIYGFDNFTGLTTNWSGHHLEKGTFNLNGKEPKVNSNVKLIKGDVENTLEIFLKQNSPQINFIHFDMDIYKPTKFVLEKIKPYLSKGAILIFDEYYNYIGWKNHEFKAFQEVFKQDEFNYESFNINSAQVMIRIL
mgnify:CR=1 FL=1